MNSKLKLGDVGYEKFTGFCSKCVWWVNSNADEGYLSLDCPREECKSLKSVIWYCAKCSQISICCKCYGNDAPSYSTKYKPAFLKSKEDDKSAN